MLKRLFVDRFSVWSDAGGQPPNLVTRNNKPVNVSAREFKLLRYLIEHSGATVSRVELLNEVWGYNTSTTTRTVDVHVSSLRQKIEEDPRNPKSIVTIHGFGFKFVSPS